MSNEMGSQFFDEYTLKCLKAIRKERRVVDAAAKIGVNRKTLASAIENGYASDEVATRITGYFHPGKKATDVMTAVKEHYGIEGEGLGDNHTARRIAAYVLRLKGLGWTEIARLTGFADHTGAMKAHGRVDKQLKSHNHEYSLPVTRIMDRAGI